MSTTVRQSSILIEVVRNILPDTVRQDVPASRQIVDLAQLYLSSAKQKLHSSPSEIPVLIAKVRCLLRHLDALYIEQGIIRDRENRIIALSWEILGEITENS